MNESRAKYPVNPLRGANLSFELQIVSLEMLRSSAPDRDELTLKDTPSCVLLKPRAAVMCLDCGCCLGCVVVTVIKPKANHRFDSLVLYSFL